MKTLLAYGTLKEGFYNFDRIATIFGKSSIQKIGELTQNGYKLVDLNYYPAAVPCKESVIKCDILQVDDKAYEFIKRMELGAGYKEQTVNQKIIYVMTDQNLNFPKIESGEWTKK